MITKSEKVQCAVFLHVAGPDTQKVAHSLDIDSNDKDKINPLKSVVRYRFNYYNQASVSMETYIRELRNRIAHCEYGVLEDSLLRDRLVCGVKDNNLRSRLLQTPGLSLMQCIEMCRLNEHKSELLNRTIENSINAISRVTPTSTAASQHTCGA